MKWWLTDLQRRPGTQASNKTSADLEEAAECFDGEQEGGDQAGEEGEWTEDEDVDENDGWCDTEPKMALQSTELKHSDSSARSEAKYCRSFSGHISHGHILITSGHSPCQQRYL